MGTAKSRSKSPKTKVRAFRSTARSQPGVPLALKRLGKRVRQLRQAAELTQEQVAERAHLDAKHLQEVEAGRVNPTVASLVGLAKALSVKLADIFEGV